MEMEGGHIDVTSSWWLLFSPFWAWEPVCVQSEERENFETWSEPAGAFVYNEILDRGHAEKLV